MLKDLNGKLTKIFMGENSIYSKNLERIEDKLGEFELLTNKNSNSFYGKVEYGKLKLKGKSFEEYTDLYYIKKYYPNEKDNIVLVIESKERFNYIVKDLQDKIKRYKVFYEKVKENNYIELQGEYINGYFNRENDINYGKYIFFFEAYFNFVKGDGPLNKERYEFKTNKSGIDFIEKNNYETGNTLIYKLENFF